MKSVSSVACKGVALLIERKHNDGSMETSSVKGGYAQKTKYNSARLTHGIRLRMARAILRVSGRARREGKAHCTHWTNTYNGREEWQS